MVYADGEQDKTKYTYEYHLEDFFVIHENG